MLAQIAKSAQFKFVIDTLIVKTEDPKFEVLLDKLSINIKKIKANEIYINFFECKSLILEEVVHFME